MNRTISAAFWLVLNILSSLARRVLNLTAPTVQAHDTRSGGEDQGFRGERSEMTGERSRAKDWARVRSLIAHVADAPPDGLCYNRVA